MAGGGEATRFRVEKDEVVGEVGGGRDEGLDVEGVEGLASEEVFLGYACFQKVTKGLEGP